MAKAPKSWREKLERAPGGKVVDTPQGKMLIPRPLDVEALVKQVGTGKLVTIAQLRERLARDAHTDYACPLTTGIFLRLVAEAAQEDLTRRVESVAPYWRVIRPDGSLIEKFPGGTEAQATRLREEGHTVLPRPGKKPPRVQVFEQSLQAL